MQQNVVEACNIAVEAVEEQKGCTIEADEEGVGSIARVWAGAVCENQGKVFLFTKFLLLCELFVWMLTALNHISCMLNSYLFIYDDKCLRCTKKLSVIVIRWSSRLWHEMKIWLAEKPVSKFKRGDAFSSLSFAIYLWWHTWRITVDVFKYTDVTVLATRVLHLESKFEVYGVPITNCIGIWACEIVESWQSEGENGREMRASNVCCRIHIIILGFVFFLFCVNGNWCWKKFLRNDWAGILWESV